MCIHDSALDGFSGSAPNPLLSAGSDAAAFVGACSRTPRCSGAMRGFSHGGFRTLSHKAYPTFPRQVHVSAENAEYSQFEREMYAAREFELFPKSLEVADSNHIAAMLADEPDPSWGPGWQNGQGQPLHELLDTLLWVEREDAGQICIPLDESVADIKVAAVSVGAHCNARRTLGRSQSRGSTRAAYANRPIGPIYLDTLIKPQFACTRAAPRASPELQGPVGSNAHIITHRHPRYAKVPLDRRRNSSTQKRQQCFPVEATARSSALPGKSCRPQSSGGDTKVRFGESATTPGIGTPVSSRLATPMSYSNKDFHIFAKLR